MIRSLIRDVVFLWIAYELLFSAFYRVELGAIKMGIYGFLILVFVLWFLLERIGFLRKPT
ncbi:MAG: hypothetical protein QW507_03360 [Candidatus Nanoarchaeia archaeon]|nr:hypothetical protein [Candidatus Haiyanarchaeum thermophilum]MCW1302881.1 hypothetical protein [Candidatus Haiyanarchaeum thermophilum]MCW1303560.1 hypothetical protein [Candidatus Haiyanarchaeum thermophilum]MCW1306242.1 hypothetical protein [Candidatus Haiyanarchaeum thermophilum]MCW1307522.1 hypothetical protein [Candidatus Haiyanarchaeum thermophilum]